MTQTDRIQLTSAKLTWRRRMRQTHPSFTKRKWANTQWRINHPQPL